MSGLHDKQYLLRISEDDLRAMWSDWIQGMPKLQGTMLIVSSADHGASDVIVFGLAAQTAFEFMMAHNQIAVEHDVAPFEDSISVPKRSKSFWARLRRHFH